MTDVRPPAASRPGFFDEEFQDEVTSVTSSTVAAKRAPKGPVPRDRATLTLLSGASAGAIFSLNEDENIIGRARECVVRVDDPGISRKHARVVREAPRVFVVSDLGSRNGTFVNAARIEKHQLVEGDRITIGPNVEFRFAFTDAAEEDMLRRLYESSVQDALTGAFNRKHFAERLSGEIAYAKRHKTPLSLLIFDLDHFKKVNDSLGHLGGDHVLCSVAAVVKRTLRAEDVLARYGGEEFAIIARGIDVEKAYRFGERVRTTVESAIIEWNRQRVPVTVSIGTAALSCCGDNVAADALVAKADERLYQAKRSGRNRTVGGVVVPRSPSKLP
jgi:two-component system cell cycle response regulator